jgi:hypothetical protein
LACKARAVWPARKSFAINDKLATLTVRLTDTRNEPLTQFQLQFVEHKTPPPPHCTIIAAAAPARPYLIRHKTIHFGGNIKKLVEFCQENNSPAQKCTYYLPSSTAGRHNIQDCQMVKNVCLFAMFKLVRYPTECQCREHIKFLRVNPKPIAGRYFIAPSTNLSLSLSLSDNYSLLACTMSEHNNARQANRFSREKKPSNILQN